MKHSVKQKSANVNGASEYAAMILTLASRSEKNGWQNMLNFLV